MPYCAKCGVEVDKDIKKCPLCDFPIPDVGEVKEDKDSRFPKMENVYPNKTKKTRNTIFAILSIILVSSVFLLGYNNIHFYGKLTWARYSIAALIAVWSYSFFLFGYIPSFRKKLSGISITTIILLYYIDSFNGKVEWFYWIGLGAVLGAYFLILISYYFLKRAKKNGINITAYSFLVISIYCLILDASIHKNFDEKFSFSWSINVIIELIPLSIVLFIISGTIGSKFILELKKKLHW
ncbi:hypothetical protein [Clostridium oceanicum]|uniref:Zinc ribbon domain-containing protein n=1 Tax=Clostridium oceanicum TaxID=1543 RepID=A0ABP3UPB7_9CLOT